MSENPINNNTQLTNKTEDRFIVAVKKIRSKKAVISLRSITMEVERVRAKRYAKKA